VALGLRRAELITMSSRRAFLTLLALAVPGCAAPTLPLPPPTALVEAPDADGFATVSGIAREKAYVFVFHEGREDGVIGVANDAGQYSLRIRAASGDLLEVWFMDGTKTSPIVDRAVP
jgi:hypothetical protein